MTDKLLKQISVMFNAHKMKYELLTKEFKYISKLEMSKYSHVFIDFNLIIKKFIHTVNYYDKHIDHDVNDYSLVFLKEFLNFITHYKAFFYKYCGCRSYIYITINKKEFGKNNELINSCLDLLKPIIDMIPEVNNIYYNHESELTYIKFHLIKRIENKNRKIEIKNIYLDISKTSKENLLYMITKDIYFLKFNGYIPYLKNFTMLKEDLFNEVDSVYMNSIISLLTVIEALNIFQITNDFKVNNIILSFIKENPSYDFNDIKTKKLILRLFSYSKKLEKELEKIEYNIKSIKLKELIETLANSWKNKIFDKNIYNLNEILNIKNDLIKIESILHY